MVRYTGKYFAACVLVPTQRLKEEVEKCLAKAGVKNRLQIDYSLPLLAELPKKFNVSPEVIIRRITKEKILLERF